jgi:hypothetical protein
VVSVPSRSGASPLASRLARRALGLPGDTKPNVLVQQDTDSTDYRFPVTVVESSSFKDVRLSVSCKPVSGKVDQGCGLVWRYTDSNILHVRFDHGEGDRTKVTGTAVRAYEAGQATR